MGPKVALNRSAVVELTRRWLAPSIVFLVTTLIVYRDVVGFPFLLDDEFHFAGNSTIHSLRGLVTTWTSSYWEMGVDGLYRPLLKSLWTAESVFLGGGRGAVLAVSLVIHVFNAACISELARRVGAGSLLALAAGAVFLLHPANVEVVANGVGQGELASLAFVLAGLCLVFPDMPANRVRQIAFLVCALAAPLVKEQGFPGAVLLGLALWLNPRYALRDKLLLGAVMGIGLAVELGLRFAVLGALGPSEGYVIAGELGFGGRVFLVASIVGRYLGLAAVPTNLSADYGWLALELPVAIGDPYLWIGTAAALVSLAVARFAVARARWPLLFLLALAWLPLIPFLHLWPIGSFFAERHLHHALAGTVLLAAYAAASLAARLPRYAALIGAAFVAWAATLGFLTHLRVPVWHDGMTLWQVTLEDHPKSALAAASLANLLEGQGEIRAAERYAKQALDLDPHISTAYVTLGNLSMRRGQPAEARDLYIRASADAMLVFPARLGLCLALLELGCIDTARTLHTELSSEHPGDAQLRQIGAYIAEAERRWPGGRLRRGDSICRSL